LEVVYIYKIQETLTRKLKTRERSIHVVMYAAFARKLSLSPLGLQMELAW